MRRAAEIGLCVGSADIRAQPHFGTQRPEQRAMRHHQHRGRKFQRTIQRGHAALAQIGKALRLLGREMPSHPIIKPASHRLAFLHAERHFTQPLIETDVKAERIAHNPGGVMRARQRRGDDADDAAIAQLRRSIMRLRDAARVERDINIALAEILRVPIRLAVAKEPERRRSQGQGHSADLR